MLEDFLADQATGEHHSSGTFSISTAAARRKLESFQLASPGLYALKIVQAACSLGASEIRVVIESDRVTIGFHGPSSQLLLNPLMAGLDSPQSLKEPSQRHLAVGMVSALVYPGAKVRFSTLTAEVGWTLTLSSIGEDTEVTAEMEPLPSLQPREGSEAAYLFELSCDRRLARRVGEHQLIYERCAFAPVKILVDGRPIEKGWGSSPPGAPKWRGGAPTWLGVRFFAGEGLDVGYGPPWPKNRKSLNEGGTSYQFDGLGLDGSCGVTSAIPSPDGNLASLRLVKDGVCLDPVDLDLQFPCRVVVAENGVPVDLSEFGPRESEPLGRAIGIALEQAEKANYSLYLNAGFLGYSREDLVGVIRRS